MKSLAQLFIFTLLFSTVVRADDLQPIDIDQFNSCKTTRDCIKVETEVCCSPAAINRKRKKKYLKELYGGKAHVPCGCVKSGRKPTCIHKRCTLPELDFK